MAALTPACFPLQTPRLLLRPVAPSDEAALCSLYSDWEVARWLPWPFTSASASNLVTDAAADLQRGSGCFLAMLLRRTSAFVGIVSLRIPALEAQPWTTDTGLGILGYSVVRDRWGNGFATEGAGGATEFAFQTPGLARLRATPLRGNLASRRILERLGFTVSQSAVRETPRYGGPQRVGDTYMLERQDWISPQSDRRTAAQSTATTGAHTPARSSWKS